MSASIIDLEGVAHILSITRDITKRKQVELALAAEKERLAVTLLSIGDGVITTDMNGNIVTINKAAEALTGWNCDEAVGQPLPKVFNIINERTRQQCENPVERVLSAGKIVELANHTSLITKDGREIVIADSGAPIHDNESRIIGVVLVFRDMTEKQKLENFIQKIAEIRISRRSCRRYRPTTSTTFSVLSSAILKWQWRKPRKSVFQLFLPTH